MTIKVITPLTWRVIAFFGAFVLLSGSIGPHIISSSILYRDHFDIYGTAGKTVLFAGLALILLIRNRVPIAMSKWRLHLLWWATVSGVAWLGAWYCVQQLIAHGHQPNWMIAAHGLLLASAFGALMACFGADNLCRIGQHYRQQLGAALGAGFGFYILLSFFYAAWQQLAGLVLHSVAWLLQTSGLPTAIIPPNTLLLDKFGVTIAQSCSGVESLALFSGLYIIVGIVDRQRLDWHRFLLIFPVALAGLFVFNILRVYGLIMAGYFINPQLAFSLFHTYAGMIFFIIYTLLFWKLSYSYLLRPRYS